MSELSDAEKAICKLCGEPMPAGEEMFKYHGYSGPCPKPPLRPSGGKEDLSDVARSAKTDEEAARNIVHDWIVTYGDTMDEGSARELTADILAHTARVRRETIERCAKWHEEQERDWRQRGGPDDGEHGVLMQRIANIHHNSAAALRALKADLFAEAALAKVDKP